MGVHSEHAYDREVLCNARVRLKDWVMGCSTGVIAFVMTAQFPVDPADNSPLSDASSSSSSFLAPAAFAVLAIPPAVPTTVAAGEQVTSWMPSVSV